MKIEKQKIELLPERAIFWHEKQMLIVSDLHLGKSSTFRANGIAIPEGTDWQDLKRLKDLAKKMDAKVCMVLGDFIHAKEGLTINVQKMLKQSLSEFSCPLELVIGNHDKALTKLELEGWNLHVHLQPFLIEPFFFAHEPLDDPDHFTFAGHIHPQTVLSGGGDSLRLPCFWIMKKQMVLPAFGTFTGGYNIKPMPEDKVYVTTGDEVLLV